MVAHIMNGTENRSGKLFWEGLNLVEVANTFKTPLVIYSKENLVSNCKKLLHSFSTYFKDFSVKYAVKANNNPHIISIISSEGCGIDASSLNEIKIAIHSGVPPENISFSPNNVSAEELKYAIQKKIIINFDSIGQFKLVSDYNIDIVSFRIKIGFGNGEFAGIITSGNGAKFGELIDNAIEGYRIATQKGFKRFGIHVMAGSNVRTPEHFGKVTREIFKVVQEIENTLHINFEFIDIGGGFGVPYKLEDEVLNLDEAARFIYLAFNEIFTNTNRKWPKLVIEPGRFITANAGILMGKVTDVKIHELNYTGTDVGMNILIRPALYGAYHHIVIANNLNEEPKFTTDITGQICENTDRIGKGVNIAYPVVGDTIAVFNCGAYVTSMASNYNGRLMPKELIIENGSIKIIRDEDTIQDLIRHTYL
jgi:diaminopimelate decarboxylase